MTDTIIAYHPITNDLVLFYNGAHYWVGCYSSGLTHTSLQSSYYLIRGYFNTELEGLNALNALTGNEF